MEIAAIRAASAAGRAAHAEIGHSRVRPLPGSNAPNLGCSHGYSTDLKADVTRMRAIHSIGGGSRLVTIKREKCCQILNVGMFQRMRTVVICVGALPVWATPHAVVSISSTAHHRCVPRGAASSSHAQQKFRSAYRRQPEAAGAFCSLPAIQIARTAAVAMR